MTAITNIRQATHLGQFRTATQYVGELVKVAANDYRVVRTRDYGNGEIVWQSAPFRGREIVKTGETGGVSEYAAR